MGRSKARVAGTVLELLRELDEDAGPTVYRTVAKAIVDMRSQYTHEGRPDWSGRSLEYREAIERLYRQAEVPPDSEAGTQAKLRYHIGNMVREVAPPEDLAALGLKPKGPAARMVDARKNGTSSRPPASVRRTQADNPMVLAALALDAARLLNVVDVAAEDRDVVNKVVRQIVDECMTYLSR